jgi:steroid delta-isomerase-like uncharacterized protein
MTSLNSAENLRKVIDRYNQAWNDHDVDTIISLHSDDMVFANHTAGESTQGKAVRAQIESIFQTWSDISFSTRRLYVVDGLVVQEWTATATHTNTMRRGDLTAEPTGNKITWDGVDIIPFENGLLKRKDVYSDSLTILRGVGLFKD